MQQQQQQQQQSAPDHQVAKCTSLMHHCPKFTRAPKAVAGIPPGIRTRGPLSTFSVAGITQLLVLVGLSATCLSFLLRPPLTSCHCLTPELSDVLHQKEVRLPQVVVHQGQWWEQGGIVTGPGRQDVLHPPPPSSSPHPHFLLGNTANKGERSKEGSHTISPSLSQPLPPHSSHSLSAPLSISLSWLLSSERLLLLTSRLARLH